MRPRNLLLLAECLLALSAATLARRLLPFRWLVRTLGRSQRELPHEHTPREANLSLRVSRGLAAATARFPWRSTCFEQAIAGKWMLRRRGVPATLYLGVRRSPSGLDAHAWLRSGPAIITGGQDESAPEPGANTTASLFPPVAWFS